MITGIIVIEFTLSEDHLYLGLKTLDHELLRPLLLSCMYLRTAGSAAKNVFGTERSKA